MGFGEGGCFLGEGVIVLVGVFCGFGFLEKL